MQPCDTRQGRQSSFKTLYMTRHADDVGTVLKLVLKSCLLWWFVPLYHPRVLQSVSRVRHCNPS